MKKLAFCALILCLSVISNGCSELNEDWKEVAQKSYALGDAKIISSFKISLSHGYVFLCDRGRVVMQEWVDEFGDGMTRQIILPEEVACTESR